MWYVDIKPVKSAGYAGQVATPGAADQGTSSSFQGLDGSALLADICRRCDVILARVSERGWQELDDQYTDECIGLPSEWKWIMQRMAMAGQVVHDL